MTNDLNRNKNVAWLGMFICLIGIVGTQVARILVWPTLSLLEKEGFAIVVLNIIPFSLTCAAMLFFIRARHFAKKMLARKGVWEPQDGSPKGAEPSAPKPCDPAMSQPQHADLPTRRSAHPQIKAIVCGFISGIAVLLSAPIFESFSPIQHPTVSNIIKHFYYGLSLPAMALCGTLGLHPEYDLGIAMLVVAIWWGFIGSVAGYIIFKVWQRRRGGVVGKRLDP